MALGICCRYLERRAVALRVAERFFDPANRCLRAPFTSWEHCVRIIFQKLRLLRYMDLAWRMAGHLRRYEVVICAATLHVGKLFSRCAVCRDDLIPCLRTINRVQRII